MKAKFLFLLFLPLIGFSQDKNKECADVMLDSLLKSDNYDSAYSLWKSTKCTSERYYLSGEKILLHKLDMVFNDAEKEGYVTNLLELYDNYDKNIPGNKNGNLVKKAMTIDKFLPGENNQIYKLLDRAFTTDKKHITDVKALYMYFDLYYSMFKSGEKGISEDNVLGKYDDVSGRLTQLIENSTDTRDYKAAKNGISSLVSPIATCKKLDEYYTRLFETRKNDTLWIKQAVSHLAERRCVGTPLFMAMATEWYKISQVPESAFHLGLAYRSAGNAPKAVEYFKIAIDLEKDAPRKAEIYYTIATNVTDQAESIGYLKKAIEVQPTYAKAYMLLAQLYSKMDCGATPFEKKALYLLAAQTVRKVVNNAGVVNKMAEIQAQKYLEKAPTKGEIKEAKQGGKTIKFGCGINESVVIPE